MSSAIEKRLANLESRATAVDLSALVRRLRVGKLDPSAVPVDAPGGAWLQALAAAVEDEHEAPGIDKRLAALEPQAANVDVAALWRRFHAGELTLEALASVPDDLPMVSLLRELVALGSEDDGAD